MDKQEAIATLATLLNTIEANLEQAEKLALEHQLNFCLPVIGTEFYGVPYRKYNSDDEDEDDPWETNGRRSPDEGTDTGWWMPSTC